MDIRDFEFKLCTPKDLDRILEIQEDTLKHLEAPELLRKNTPEMLLECLQAPNVTVGAWYQGRLVAFSILYFPQEEAECLASALDGVDVAGLRSVNYKLCIVDRAFRGHSLQYELGKRLLQYAREANADIICATASPDNAYSIANIERLGFVLNKSLEKYGFSRNLYYQLLNR